MEKGDRDQKKIETEIETTPSLFLYLCLNSLSVLVSAANLLGCAGEEPGDESPGRDV